MNLRHALTESSTLRYVAGAPLDCFGQWQPKTCEDGSLLLVDFDLQQYWLPKSESLALTALFFRDTEGMLSVSVTDRSLQHSESNPAKQYAAWAAQHRFARAQPGLPLALAPTFIAKPWGREIWFTGVEQRGVCKLHSIEGETPIPWLQAVMPGEALGVSGAPLILLKILDPVAQPVVGDLYFELHDEKREVYIVTSVDPSAWPGGTGFIRFGFATDKRALFQDEESFRAAYLDAVRRYEVVRREIDGAGQSPLPEQSARIAQEVALRGEMDSFTHMKPLRVGDVVKVPLLTPHALQHGVRTIEFQTPVYERKILSFAQKVLTQDHWDTEDAVSRMRLDQPPPDQFEILKREQGVLVERIVDFSDFEVRRVRLDRGKSLSGFAVELYALVMVVQGQLQVGAAVYGPEEALLLPRGWRDSLASAEPATSLVFLLALPRNTAVES